MKKKIAWSNDEVFAISWLCNRYLDICRLKKRQARSAKVMIAKWRLHGSRVRLSNQLACDLDLAWKRGKEGTIDLKFLLSITFFPFPPPFPRLVHALYFQLTFLVTHSWTITRTLFLQWKIEKSKLPFKNQRNIDYQVSTWLIPSEFQNCEGESINNNFNFFAQFFPPPWFTKEEENCPE